MSFQDASESPEFKAWLVTTLEPMCDADPQTLADYVEALLKHSTDMGEEEWKIFITRELADFLEDHAKPFTELLYSTLRNRSYVSAGQASTVLPPSLPVIPTQAPAINPNAPPTAPSGPGAVSSFRPPTVSAGPAVAGPSAKRENGDVDMEGGQSQGQGQGQGQGRQGRKCYDYHEKGYCMRGANCPYEHDEAVIIPTPEMMFSGMFNMPPQRGRGGRGGGRGGRGGRGGPPGPHHQHGGHPPPGFPGMPGMPGMPFMPFPFAQPMPPSDDPRSEFWGTNRPPSDRTSTTLVISDIPQQHLSVPEIRDYFQQFGEVTNIALEGRSKRALISFGTNREAYQAWKSDAAVFGSRHVKVLWHRPRPGQGEAGQKALDASKNLMENMKKIESGEGVQGNVKAIHSGPQELLQKTLLELEATERRSKKETLIAEQKVLLKRTEGASKEEKMKLLARLRELTKEMDEVDKPRQENKIEGGEKEKLDKELERLGMETTAGKDQEELIKLNAQLAALKDKASSLGVPSNRYSPYGRGGTPRGRGRGRGRGGASSFPPRSSLTLDNRSRSILVSGDEQSSEAQNSIKEYYESNGGNVTINENVGFVVTYPNREMAEKVLSLGTSSIPHVNGAVKVAWHNDTPTTRTDTADVEMGMGSGEDQRRGDRDGDE